MKIKVGDTVKVISGSSKGKEGKVSLVLRSENRLIIEGVNLVKKHMKPNNQNESGGILEKESPIHISNVKVITKSDKKESKKAPIKKEIKEEKPKKSTKKESKE